VNGTLDRAKKCPQFRQFPLIPSPLKGYNDFILDFCDLGIAYTHLVIHWLLNMTGAVMDTYKLKIKIGDHEFERRSD
jgi:hypothetical protein